MGIWLLGIVITLPLLCFLYALIEGREKWYTALIMAVCTYLLIWGLFEYMLEARWPALPIVEKHRVPFLAPFTGARAPQRFVCSRSGFDEQLTSRASQDPTVTLVSPADIYA